MDTPQYYMDAAGPAAEGLASLGWLIIVTFLVVTAAVWILIGWIALRRRGSLAEHAPIDTNQGQSWILIGGLAIPIVVLAVLFIVSTETLTDYPLHAPADATPTIRVVGQQWWFDATYLSQDLSQRVSVPTEIHIPVGLPVDIELQSRDVIHSFWVPKLHGKVEMIPGVANRIRIEASRPGVYRGECAEFCGMQHAHMRLEVIAHPLAEYEAWVEHQRAPAPKPTTVAEKRGYQLFMRTGCMLCHTIRGTPARGKIGPDLTHVGSRRRIAGGMLENNTANMAAWVTHAQALKPGSRMPDMTMFNGEELRALVAYVQSLK